MKVVQATHHQGDIRYGMSFFKSESIWDSFNLDCILQKGDLLFKSLNWDRRLTAGVLY